MVKSMLAPYLGEVVNLVVLSRGVFDSASLHVVSVVLLLLALEPPRRLGAFRGEYLFDISLEVLLHRNQRVQRWHDCLGLLRRWRGVGADEVAEVAVGVGAEEVDKLQLGVVQRQHELAVRRFERAVVVLVEGAELRKRDQEVAVPLGVESHVKLESKT